MKHWILATVGLVLLCSTTISLAGEEPSVQELLARLEQMEERMAQMERELELARSLAAAAWPPSTERVRAIIRQELAGQPAAARPEWADGLKFGGTMRLRHEWEGNADADDRQRFRYLLLLSFEKAITEELSAGFELATAGPDPTSHNETLGDAFDKDDVYVNRAYMTYKPSSMPGLTLTAGKHKNVWDPIKAKMLWDSDISPEGILLRYDFEAGRTLHPWAQVEYFLVDENHTTPDADGLAFQIGAKTDLSESMKLTAAASYYNFDDMNYAGDVRTRENFTDPGGALASDFNLLDLAAELSFKLADTPCSVFAEYVENDDTSSGINEYTAWKAGVRVGTAKKPGRWALQLDYSYVEADAIVSGFGDSDHGRSNYRGPTAKLSYCLFDNTTLSATVYCLDVVHGNHDNYMLTQLDLVVKF